MSGNIHGMGTSEKERLDRVYNDVYFGNGLPGLVTRMKQSEDRHDAMDQRCDKSDKTIANTQKMFWAIIILLFSILATTLVDTLKSHEQSAAGGATHSFNY